MRLTDRGRAVLVVAVLVVAFLLGLTAEWWDPWARGTWSP